MIEFDQPLTNDEKLALSELLFLCERIAGAGYHARINPLADGTLGKEDHSWFYSNAFADSVRQVCEGFNHQPHQADVPP